MVISQLVGLTTVEGRCCWARYGAAEGCAGVADDGAEPRDWGPDEGKRDCCCCGGGAL